MPKQLNTKTLSEMIAALGIDVPVLSFDEQPDGTFVLHLYGGGVRHWPPTASVVIEAQAAPPRSPRGRPRKKVQE